MRRGIGQAPDLKNTPVFPYPGLGAIRADFGGIAPGIDRKTMWGEGSSDMDATAIHPDQKRRTADEPDQLGKRRAIEEIVDIFHRGHGLIATTGEDNAERSE